ncbi:MAG: UDP-N-acetylmuramate--L-alanine ligase [Chloroflexota bacterium]
MSERRLRDAQRVHLVGIGGSGMSALASLLLQMGRSVSGSELTPGAAIDQLRDAGAAITSGHAAENVIGAEYVVRSAAIPLDNAELVVANAQGVPVRTLADAVGELMADRSTVAIAGTHGKTTTTSLVGWLLEQGGLDPLVLVGADTPAFPLGAKLGDGPVVIEADEYDRRFLSYWPEVVVVTSVEADHLDYYTDLAEIQSVFAELASRVPSDGRLIVCADQLHAAALTTGARRETYGFAPSADWSIGDYAGVPGDGAAFTLRADGREFAIRSPLVGRHNAQNAAAAFAVADYFGVGLRASIAAITTFEGPRRRFETKGEPSGVRVVDDYGHHPTEVAAVLNAARAATEGQVWVVFQPHTTNRTAALFDEFGRAFADADHALILPIYRPHGRDLAARPVSAEDLVKRLGSSGHPDARFAPDFGAAEAAVTAGVRPGDIVITMGAGDVTQLSDRLVAALAPHTPVGDRR